MASGTQRVHRFHKQAGWYVQGDREVAVPIAHLCCCQTGHMSDLMTSLVNVVVFEVEAVGKVCFHSLQASMQELFLNYTFLEAGDCSLEHLTGGFHTVVDHKTVAAAAEAGSEAADIESLTVVDADGEAGVAERLACEAGVELQAALTAVEDAGTGAEVEVVVIDSLAVEGLDV